MIEKNTDYLGEARALLTAQFKNKPRIDALLRAWMAEFQAVEDAAWDVFIFRLLQTGNIFGDLEDKIGAIVGQARQGMSDAEYLVFITARIAANRSDGKRETLIKITKLLLPDVALYVKEYTGAIIIRAIDPITNPDVIARQFLIGAVVAGVRMFFVWSSADTEHTFTSDWSVTPIGVATQGFSWSGDLSLGGQFAGSFAGPEES